MTIKFDKKTYVAPKMKTIELKSNAQILCGSDSFAECEEEEVELGSIGIFGNDKA